MTASGYYWISFVHTHICLRFDWDIMTEIWLRHYDGGLTETCSVCLPLLRQKDVGRSLLSAANQENPAQAWLHWPWSSQLPPQQDTDSVHLDKDPEGLCYTCTHLISTDDFVKISAPSAMAQDQSAGGLIKQTFDHRLGWVQNLAQIADPEIVVVNHRATRRLKNEEVWGLQWEFQSFTYNYSLLTWNERMVSLVICLYLPG